VVERGAGESEGEVAAKAGVATGEELGGVAALRGEGAEESRAIVAVN
jgi:hypothetical protein